MYILNVAVLVVTASAFVSLDSLFFCYCEMIAVEFQILQERIKSIKYIKLNVCLVKEKLIECIGLHSELCK